MLTLLSSQFLLPVCLPFDLAFVDDEVADDGMYAGNDVEVAVLVSMLLILDITIFGDDVDVTVGAINVNV